MMNITSIVFPDGLYGQKLRYLTHGFEMLGITTSVNPNIKRQIAVPININIASGEIIHAFLDVWVEKSKFVKSLVDGKNFYFKTHLDSTLIPKHKRLFPMPQALGDIEYLSMIPELRKARRMKSTMNYQVFAAFAYSAQRARACEIVKRDGFIAKYLGINKDRHGTATLTCPRLSRSAYLNAMAEAEIALSLPSCHGNDGGGPWCSFRHVEAWALGAPILTITPKDYSLLGTPERFWFETEPDLIDLAEDLKEALDDHEKCRIYSDRSIDYFERFLRPERHALYFLRTIEDELKGS